MSGNVETSWFFSLGCWVLLLFLVESNADSEFGRECCVVDKEVIVWLLAILIHLGGVNHQSSLKSITTDIQYMGAYLVLGSAVVPGGEQC